MGGPWGSVTGKPNLTTRGQDYPPGSDLAGDERNFSFSHFTGLRGPLVGHQRAAGDPSGGRCHHEGIGLWVLHLLGHRNGAPPAADRRPSPSGSPAAGLGPSSQSSVGPSDRRAWSCPPTETGNDGLSSRLSSLSFFFTHRKPSPCPPACADATPLLMRAALFLHRSLHGSRIVPALFLHFSCMVPASFLHGPCTVPAFFLHLPAVPCPRCF